MSQLSFEWTKKHATWKSKEYMDRLPARLSIMIEGRKAMFFHATPRKNNLYWYADRPEKFFQEMADKADADILVYGHTHKPYRKRHERQTLYQCRKRGQAERRRSTGMPYRD